MTVSRKKAPLGLEHITKRKTPEPITDRIDRKFPGTFVVNRQCRSGAEVESPTESHERLTVDVSDPRYLRSLSLCSPSSLSSLVSEQYINQTRPKEEFGHSIWPVAVAGLSSPDRYCRRTPLGFGCDGVLPDAG